MRKRLIRVAFILSLVFLTSSVANGEEGTVADIREVSGVRGGLVVHVGCGGGRFTTDLCAVEGYLVHGLDADAEHVRAARQHVHSRGLSDSVSIARWDGPRLPYLDNMVNLLVVGEPGAVKAEEAMRVLAPGGVLLTRGRSGWDKAVKPSSDETDEWTHYLHGPDNNAVAEDTVIDFPSGLQWIGGPLYDRHHDHMAGVSAAVSADGRLFSIIDEATPGSVEFPPRWRLAARDAYNGTVLWKRPIERWHPHLWPLKMGPALLPRRLVAVGDRVYATLGIEAPVSELDAATGRTVRVFEETAGTSELICEGGVLLAVVRSGDEPPREGFESLKQLERLAYRYSWEPQPARLRAFDTESGRLLWERRTPVAPMTPAARGGRIYYHDGGRIQCVEARSGDDLWRSAPLPVSPEMPSWYCPTLVVRDGLVFFSGGDVKETLTEHARYGYFSQTGGFDTMHVLDAATGEQRWTAEHPPSGYRSPEDLFVIDGKVWCGNYTAPRGEKVGRLVCRDARTGEVLMDFMPDIDVPWFHHRCHRAKATSRFLLLSRMGVEFVDVETGNWTPHHWTRGACLYGILPCNGMLYIPPNPCTCYQECQLTGYHALNSNGVELDAPGSASGRHVRGPAYEEYQQARRRGDFDYSDEWPTYRRDAARSGCTPAAVPEDLDVAWRTSLEGDLSPPVVAGGRVFVSVKGRNMVAALDARTGEKEWFFLTGAPVDSPPTIHRGLALFGCTDGWVYALRAADGGLVWKFRAAPQETYLQAFGTLQSVWPVHGSLLVMDGTIYCVAGRSMFLDGGLRMLRLDAATGRMISEKTMDNTIPGTGESLHSLASGKQIAVTLPDILSSDGERIYMRSLQMTPEFERINLEPYWAGEQEGEGVHLFSGTGFLDDQWWHRSYWIYGRAPGSGASIYYGPGKIVPAGRILSFDDENVYGFGRQWRYFRWSTAYEYRLFSTRKTPKAVKPGKTLAEDEVVENKGGHVNFGYAPYKTPELKIVCNWEETDVPLLGRAMVVAGDSILVAGPPDILDEEQAAETFGTEETDRRLQTQLEAWEGAHGGILMAFSRQDGERHSRLELDSSPVFDGMAAADGRVFLSMEDGTIVCYGPQ